MMPPMCNFGSVMCGHRTRDCSPRISDFRCLPCLVGQRSNSKYHMLDHERNSVTSSQVHVFSGVFYGCSTKAVPINIISWLIL